VASPFVSVVADPAWIGIGGGLSLSGNLDPLRLHLFRTLVQGPGGLRNHPITPTLTFAVMVTPLAPLSRRMA